MLEIPKRPSVLPGFTFMYNTGCGRMYITTTFTRADKKLQEVFVQNGKAGSCFNCHANSEGRLASVHLRTGGTPERIIKHLSGLTCGTSTAELLACPACIAEALKEAQELLKELP